MTMKLGGRNGAVYRVYKLTKRATRLWEDSGPVGDDFRKSTRAAAKRLGRLANAKSVEITAQDGTVFDVLDLDR